MHGQLLNEITQAYANLSVGWLDTLLPMAQRIFVVLATIELAWSGIWWAFIARKDENLIANMVHKLMVIMFFYTVVLFASSWIPWIISGFITAGSAASGFDSLNPSNVLQAGLDTAVLLWKSAKDAYGWYFMPAWAYLSPPLIVIAFAIMAGILVVTLIEAYIVIGGGVLMLAFAGSRWTSTLAEGYLLYAIKVGIRLFTLYLLIGVGMGLPAQWIEVLDTVRPGSPKMELEVMAGSIVLLMVVWKVPLYASSMIYHRANLRLDRAYEDVG